MDLDVKIYWLFNNAITINGSPFFPLDNCNNNKITKPHVALLRAIPCFIHKWIILLMKHYIMAWLGWSTECQFAVKDYAISAPPLTMHIYFGVFSTQTEWELIFREKNRKRCVSVQWSRCSFSSWIDTKDCTNSMLNLWAIS